MKKGYKVFNSDWKCREFQYEVGKRYKTDKNIGLCEKGFHYCEKLIDCFNYYSFNPNNKVAEVIAHGNIIDGENKNVTNDIEIVKEITWYEVLDMVNIGKRNTGYRNTGDWNTSSYNAGCFNTKENAIKLFNKESNLTYYDWLISDARNILINVPEKIKFIQEIEMTEKEKQENKGYETTGGYLKTSTDKELKKERQQWYDDLSGEEKQEIKSIPNFDAEIFEQCTMIRV
jgi:hypothetical protein